MLLGKMLRGLTGTPMRMTALANSSLAEAEPEPLTLANLMTKSLMASMRFMRSPVAAGAGRGRPAPPWSCSSRNFCMSQAPVGQRSAHRPQCRQTSSSLTITRPVFSPPETYRSCARLSAGAFRRVRRSGSSPLTVKVMQSIGQMSTQASHSMQADLGEHGLHVAVQAAPRLLDGRGDVEAQFDLHLDAGQRLLGLGPWHLEALVVGGVVVVAPLVDAHLLRHQVGHRRRAGPRRPRRAAAGRSTPRPRGRGPRR